MKNKLLIIVGIVIVLAIAGIYNMYFKNNSITVNNSNPGTAAVVTDNSNAVNNNSVVKDSQSMKSTGNLFADSPAYKHAYQIFPGQLSSDAQTALAGFDMKTENLGNNSYRITLVAKAHDYKDQSVVISDGQKLYFVETSWGDDEANQDYAYRDDYTVVVDTNGYILK